MTYVLAELSEAAGLSDRTGSLTDPYTQRIVYNAFFIEQELTCRNGNLQGFLLTALAGCNILMVIPGTVWFLLFMMELQHSHCKILSFFTPA